MKPRSTNHGSDLRLPGWIVLLRNALAQVVSARLSALQPPAAMIAEAANPQPPFLTGGPIPGSTPPLLSCQRGNF